MPLVLNFELLMGEGPPRLFHLGLSITLVGNEGLRIDQFEAGHLFLNGPFEGEEVISTSAGANCISDTPIGGRLALFAAVWEKSTSDK